MKKTYSLEGKETFILPLVGSEYDTTFLRSNLAASHFEPNPQSGTPSQASQHGGQDH